MCLQSRVTKTVFVVLSFLSICGGISTIALTWYLISDNKLMSTEQVASVTKKLAVVTGVAGAVAILYGLLGFAAAKVMKGLCLCSFGVFSLIVLAYSVLVSLVLVFTVTRPPEFVTDFCTATSFDDKPGWLQSLMADARKSIYNIDTNMLSMVNAAMCRKVCPCVKVDYSLWPEPLSSSLKTKSYFFTGTTQSLADCYTANKQLWTGPALSDNQI